MFVYNHKEREIEWKSYRLKLWYYHAVMTSFFSFQCLKTLWNQSTKITKINSKIKDKNETNSIKNR